MKDYINIFDIRLEIIFKEWKWITAKYRELSEYIGSKSLRSLDKIKWGHKIAVYIDMRWQIVTYVWMRSLIAVYIDMRWQIFTYLWMTSSLAVNLDMRWQIAMCIQWVKTWGHQWVKTGGH